MAFSSAFLVIFLFLTGCAQIKGYDLSVMPSYRVQETNRHYEKISEAKTIYAMLNRANAQMQKMGITIDENQENEIILTVDKYLYWISVAHIQLFYQQYDLSDKSCELSIHALEEYRLILQKIIDSKSV
jgi:hypothetical protein